jgi:hypothetical protein
LRRDARPHAALPAWREVGKTRQLKKRTFAHHLAAALIWTRKGTAMSKRTKAVSVMLAGLSIPASITFTLAGDVKLVSDNWDNICRVEITWGADAPNGTPVEHHSDVRRNWSITKPDRLCYRRASTPENCDSGMTQWNTQWICAAKTDSGIEELSLK